MTVGRARFSVDSQIADTRERRPKGVSAEPFDSTAVFLTRCNTKFLNEYKYFWDVDQAVRLRHINVSVLYRGVATVPPSFSHYGHLWFSGMERFHSCHFTCRGRCLANSLQISACMDQGIKHAGPNER